MSKMEKVFQAISQRSKVQRQFYFKLTQAECMILSKNLTEYDRRDNDLFNELHIQHF